MENKKEKRFFSLKEASNILGIDLAHLYYLKNRGVLFAQKRYVSKKSTHRTWQISERELENLREKFDR